MTSMFTFLTVRERDRLTSMIERGGIVAVGDVRDELTEIHGELVTGWQAEFYANYPASYERPAGAEVCRCGDLIERCTYPECLAHFRGWVHTDGRPAAHTCADRIGIAEPADDGDQGDGTDPGAFPVMGATGLPGARERLHEPSSPQVHVHASGHSAVRPVVPGAPRARERPVSAVSRGRKTPRPPSWPSRASWPRPRTRPPRPSTTA